MAFDNSKMYAEAIAAAGGGYEPQRSNNAVLSIEGLGDDDLLRLSLDTFPLPKQQNGSIELDYLNEKRKVAGKVTIDDMDIVFKDFVDKATAKILWDWRLKVYDPATGQIGLAKDYKKSGVITMFAPNGTLQREWNLYGMWPMNMDPGDIDMAGEDALKITMSIAIDRATFGKSTAPAGAGT